MQRIEGGEVPPHRQPETQIAYQELENFMQGSNTQQEFPGNLRMIR